ncbi:MAG: hypothetical protein RML45_07615 [Acetobacteraceae bacterium]|nr:hypothetical protein [Acetobacteraceae bacterium]
MIDLAVAEPEPWASRLLDAEMHAARPGEPQDCAVPAKRSGEVDVLVPGVKRQAFVDPNACVSHHVHPHRHVAAVAVEVRLHRQRVFGRSVGGEDRTRLLWRQSWTFRPVGDHRSGGDDAIGPQREDALEHREIVGGGEEVVVEEEENVGRRRLQDRVALARQAWA